MRIEPPPPSLRLKIDRAALAQNWRTLDAMSRPARAGAAIKADCYGLGTEHCLPVLRDAGARDFFVAHWSEVPAALQHVAPEQLSVLHGQITPEDARFARAAGVRPVINSVRQAVRWVESGGGPCDLMVDTGINRLGIDPGQIGDSAVQALEVETLMSHLARADEDSPMNARQLSLFTETTKAIAHRRASLANSAGIALGTDYAFDLTRPGLALYGGIAHSDLADSIRQVACPQAALIAVRDLEAGETVGYNATFTAPAAMRVGVVSLGYADGILRCWHGGRFLAGGNSLPMLGTISMDMIVVDLAAAPQLGEGDWVDLPYHLPDAAQQTSLSQYELLTILGDRLART